MKKNILLITNLLFSTIAFSQIVVGNEEFSTSNFQNWKTDKIEKYQGSYSFGFSESESELRIFITDSLVCVQSVTYKWSKSNNPLQWIPSYKNFTNVKIVDNEFFSDQTNGKFSIFKSNSGQSVGIIIEKPWSDCLESSETEFGKRFPDKEPYLVGKYPECSTKKLHQKDLKNFSSNQLKIMRNEIFARYGYRFIQNGKMDKYFKNFDWYKPIYEDVSSFLTDIEKANIKEIKKIEKNGL